MSVRLYVMEHLREIASEYRILYKKYEKLIRAKSTKN